MADAPRGALPRLMGHTAVYGAARVFIGALDLILLPLYTRILTPDEYGLVALGTAVLGVLGLVYPAGLDTALGRFFFDYEPGSDEQRRAIGSIGQGAALVGLACAVLLSAVGPSPWGDLLGGVTHYFYLLLVWSGFLGLFAPLWLQLLQARQEPRRYLRFAILQAAARASLTLLFVVMLRRGANGWAEAYLGAAGISAVAAVLRLRRAGIPGLDRRLLGEAFRYGVPLLVHQVAGWAAVSAGRLILNQLTSLRAVGVYQVAFGVGQMLGLVTTAVNFAYAPTFMAAARRSPEEVSATFSRLVTYYVAALTAVAVLMSLFAHELVALLAPPEFAGAAALVPVLVAASVTQGCYYVLASPIFYRKELTAYLPAITLMGGVTSVVGSYLLVPRLGGIGAAWAALAGNVVVVAAAYPLAQRALRMQYDVPRILAVMLLGAGLIAVSRALPAGGLPSSIPLLVNVGLAAIYLLALVALNILSRETVRGAVALLARRP